MIIYISDLTYVYEEYHVVMGKDGHLALSTGVEFEEICANMVGDVITSEYLDDYPEETVG